MQVLSIENVMELSAVPKRRVVENLNYGAFAPDFTTPVVKQTVKRTYSP